MNSTNPKYFVKDVDIEKNYSRIYDIDSYAFDRENKSNTMQNQKKYSKN